MNVNDIKGLAVVSIDNGAKLGRVDDLLFDPRQLRAAALRISAGGQDALVPYDQIRAIGKDAVTIPSHDLTQWSVSAAAFAGLPRSGDFGKLKVVDEAGTFLGTVDDVNIAPEDGRILWIRAKKGGILGLGADTHAIQAEEITSVGPEVIVVSVRPVEQATPE